jgi:hypothetical protein
MQIGSRGLPHLAKNERDMGPFDSWSVQKLDQQVLTQTLKPLSFLRVCGTTKVVP